MKTVRVRTIAIVVAAAAVIGLVFAVYSTYDYALHLDRQMHSVHCSFIPGAPADSDDSACKAALFSPYSAIFRATYWGGIPISLFAVGAFAFYAAFGAYLFLAKERAPRSALAFLGLAGLAPLVASLVMFVISLTKLGSFCKLCVGIYVCSMALAAAAMLALVRYRRTAPDEKEAPKDGEPYRANPPVAAAAPAGGLRAQLAAPAAAGERRPIAWLPFAWLGGLGAAALLPALVYVASLPDYRPYLSKCGNTALKPDPHNALVKIPTAHPVQPVTLFEDPLCPTCKAFHQRLVADDIFDRLDVTLVLFPLDSSCNWMLDRSLHPGACLLSGAVLCSADNNNARAALEWSYDNQDDLREAGKAGDAALKKKISDRFGPAIAACASDKKTTVRLTKHLHHAANNHVPVSTPQMFLGDKRVCEEDTDLGLKYTLAQLAPAVVK
jgi:uncharacterized membrane protein/protein-disulfide isomerase